jgi:hypothetical protein
MTRKRDWALAKLDHFHRVLSSDGFAPAVSDEQLDRRFLVKKFDLSTRWSLNAAKKWSDRRVSIVVRSGRGT